MNLTPHSVDVFSSSGEKIMSIEPSGIVLRAPIKKQRIGEIDGIPVYSIEYQLPKLPAKKENVIYIVSSIVLIVLKMYGVNRKDFIAPDTSNAVRDSEGRTLGVKGFIVVR